MANHQYHLADFTAALQAGNLPAVSFLKAAKYQDGHPGYSDPLDEQHFLVNTLNALQKSKDWRSTAVVIAYDESDGWYDHQPSPIVNPSQSPQDALTSPGICGSTTPPLAGFQDRCGYGPRTPLLVISPTPSETSSTTPSPTRPRSCASSRTTGCPAPGSTTAPSTPSPDHLPPCSTSTTTTTER